MLKKPKGALLTRAARKRFFGLCNHRLPVRELFSILLKRVRAV
jgi:hypothetical protein